MLLLLLLSLLLDLTSCETYSNGMCVGRWLSRNLGGGLVIYPAGVCEHRRPR